MLPSSHKEISLLSADFFKVNILSSNSISIDNSGLPFTIFMFLNSFPKIFMSHSMFSERSRSFCKMCIRDRLIGMIYRIPMANILGDEGNGVYSAAFEIYNILLIISSYGMPMAVSKMVSAKISQKRYKSAYKIFRCSMTCLLYTSRCV